MNDGRVVGDVQMNECRIQIGGHHRSESHAAVPGDLVWGNRERAVDQVPQNVR
jgi:hypothetical protein